MKDAMQTAPSVEQAKASVDAAAWLLADAVKRVLRWDEKMLEQDRQILLRAVTKYDIEVAALNEADRAERTPSKKGGKK